MLRLFVFLANLFQMLPWWGVLAVIVGLVAVLFLLAKYALSKFELDLIKSVASQGVALTDAVASVNSVQPAPAPVERSAYDIQPEDEEYDPEIDDEWPSEDEVAHFTIDVTVAPRQPDAAWDPSALSVVRADFQPQEDLEFCMETGLLHTVEVYRNGRFEPHRQGNVTGPQRLRLLVALPHGVSDVKFAYHFTYFGRATLPVAVAAGR